MSHVVVSLNITTTYQTYSHDETKNKATSGLLDSSLCSWITNPFHQPRTSRFDIRHKTHTFHTHISHLYAQTKHNRVRLIRYRCHILLNSNTNTNILRPLDASSVHVHTSQPPESHCCCLDVDISLYCTSNDMIWNKIDDKQLDHNIYAI